MGHEKMTGNMNMRTTILIRQIYIREIRTGKPIAYWQSHLIPFIRKKSHLAKLQGSKGHSSASDAAEIVRQMPCAS